MVKCVFAVQMCVWGPGEGKITSNEDFMEMVGLGEEWVGAG